MLLAFSVHPLLITKPTSLFIMSSRLCTISLWSITKDEWVTLDTKTLKTAGKSSTSESDFLKIVRLCSSVCILNLCECVWKKDGDRQMERERRREWFLELMFFFFFSPDMPHIPSALQISYPYHGPHRAYNISPALVPTQRTKPLSIRNKQRDVFKVHVRAVTA